MTSRKLLSLLLLTAAAAAFLPTLPLPQQAAHAQAAITVDDRVSASAEDAEEEKDDLTNGPVDITSPDIDLDAPQNMPVEGAVIFQLNVPQGATINDAFIQFTANDSPGNQTTVTVTAQDIGDAPDFSTSESNFNNRTRTAASQTATVTTDFNGERGPDQRLNNLSALVQEVVNRSDWQSGNQIAFFIEPAPTSSGNSSFVSYDGDQSGLSEDDPNPNQDDTGRLVVEAVIQGTPDAGWRMFSPPFNDITINDLAGQNLIQSIDGGQYASTEPYPPNIYDGYDPGDGCFSDENDSGSPSNEGDTNQSGDGTSDTYDCPDNMSVTLQSGEGFIWYIYDEARVPETDPIPWAWNPSGTEPTGDVTVNSDEDVLDGDVFHLLGNPYDTNYNLDDLNLETDADGDGTPDFSNVVQIWNPNAGAPTDPNINGDVTGEYFLVTRGDTDGYTSGRVAKGQGFFVERNDTDGGGATQLTFLSTGQTAMSTPFIGRSTTSGPSVQQTGATAAHTPASEQPRVVKLRLSSALADGTPRTSSTVKLYMAEGATRSTDAYEASALTPLGAPYAVPAFERTDAEGETALKSQVSLPRALTEAATLPLSVYPYGDAGSEMTFTWPRIENVPEDWTLALTDTQTGQSVDLRAQNEYTFTYAGGRSEETTSSSEKEQGNVAPAPLPGGQGLRLSAASKATTDGDGGARFQFTVDPGALPVEMTGLRAAGDGPGAAVLTWQTLSETNNAGFEVQQKKGGHFTRIGYVEGAGTSTEARHYHFRATDLSPGRHQFRLHQLDVGSRQGPFSKVVEATVVPEERYVLKAPYPNPTSGQATVAFAVRESQAVTVELYNALGQRVRVLHEGAVPAGEMQHVSLEAGDLASGLYIVRLRGEGGMRTETLTLVR